MRAIKHFFKKVFNQFGYEISRIGFNSLSGNMEGAISRLRSIGIDPAIVIDMGAAKGSWTQLALKRWPDSNYFLVEPLKEQIAQIPNTIKENQLIKITEAAVGRHTGEEILTIADDLDGSGLYGGGGANTRKVPIVAIDDLLKKTKGTVLLKLDTHGFEIPIFEGAEETLKRTDVVIVEVYGFHVGPLGKLFHEVSGYLESKGFRLFDIVDIIRRSKDKAFWQADAIYIRSKHEVFTDKSYH